MPGLILEGGALRGVFTAGALDALLDNDIHFKYIIGVSAGITNGYSYASQQRGRNWEIIRRYRRSPRYLSPLNYLRERSIFGLNFIYGDIPNKLLPYDYDALSRFDGKIIAGVTNPLSGMAEYYSQEFIDDELSLLRATCAIPHMFPAIPFNDGFYYDGGIADPIPLRKSILDGNEKNLIIMTREPGYVKLSDQSSKMSVRALERKYPRLSETIRDRHLIYNGTVKMAERLESEGKAIMLRPDADVNVKRLEKDLTRLYSLYLAGYGAVSDRLEDIKALFD